MSPLVSFLACLATCASPGDCERRVPSYTNADLERVAPLRGQTGVLTQPAFAPGSAPERGSDDASRTPRERGEAYWRRESARLRERVASLARRAKALERRIAGNGATRSNDLRNSARNNALVRQWEEQRRELLERMRSMQSELEDRARKEGALPGWLR